jgi:hypothetical protein
MFLLDTVVLSELRQRRRDAGVLAWFASVSPDELFLSVVTVAEIERGIELRRADNPAFAAELGDWLDLVVRGYADRVLPLDLAIARRWGRLAARIGNAGFDLAIAATAIEHGLTVVTRNESDFSPTGVAILNPFGPRRQRP